MNKHLHNSLRALFLSLAVLLSLPMLAEEIDGINYDLNAETKLAAVIKKSSGKYSGVVVIPESVVYGDNAYSVTSIGNYAFEGCSGLASVTIPNSVTSMGDCAFFNCSGLTSVTIGNGVASIGTSTFEYCSGLTSVTIGNSVTSIGTSAFSNCSGLTSVTIPNSVTSIGNAAFYNCSGLTSVTIPNSVTSIGGEAFRDCSKLSDVYCYAEEVPTTSSNAFVYSSIANATLHVPAGSINSYTATAPWSSFRISTEVEIDGINYELVAKVKQATVIAKSSGKYSGEVIIPESVTHESTAYSVTSIGDFAFSDCSGLTSVTIPNSVTSIGEYAFDGCSGLTSIHISDIAVWCNIDFDGYYSNPLRYAHHLYLNGEEVKDLVIPNSVTSIGWAAFYGCSGLTSVTIPNSVTSIGDYAFYDCDGLTSVHISDIAAWFNIDFEYYSSNPLTYAHHLYLNGEEVKDLVIPNSVTSIGEWAFYFCSGLTSVTIPNSVTSMGNNAFNNCSGLTSVTIPNSVTSIGNMAFEGCSGLISIVVEDGNPVYDSRNNCNAIIETATNTLHSGCKTTIIPNSVTSIGSNAFSFCSGLTSVTIPNSVTSIGGFAFVNCFGLTSVTIPNSVTSIGEGAFANCPKLHDVYCYAENVPSTDSYAFEDSPIASATLHVRDASINSYRTTEPWSGFGTITLIEDLTLADGEEFENNTEECFATLTYTRTLPNMLWNPLYVPFKIPYEVLEENYEVAYINAMHSYDNDDNGEIDEMVMEIVKIKAGTLKPNHPYLIKAKNEEAKEMSIVQENATLYPAEITTLVCSSVYTKFEITGTYHKMTSEELNGRLVVSTDGAWKLLSSTSILKPFRFYLTISNLEGSPVEIAEEAMSSVRIRVMGESDNATGIDETENTENSVVFDLYGRRVSTPAKGGVYIINGKKVIY